jgi:hypothetical protein
MKLEECGLLRCNSVYFREADIFGENIAYIFTVELQKPSIKLT